MRLNGIVASTFAIVVSSTFVSAGPLWQPSDYDGAFVRIIDDATNGCWTNIGEVRKYAEDQLALAGFEVVEEPKKKSDFPSPLLRENWTAYTLHVNASRQENGMCIGYLNSSFWGAVAPGYDQSKLIVSQIGPPFIWSVWNKENLDQYMYDQVKDTIEAWVELGEVKGSPG